MRRISIFDLPLELREMIYEDILPEDRTLTFPSPHSKTLLAFFKTDERLEREYQAVSRRKVRGLRIMVLSSRPQAFKFGAFKFEHVKELEICLDYRDRTFDKGSLGTLRSNLIRLVERLAQSNELMEVSIKYCINGLETVYGDLDEHQIRKQWEMQDPGTYTDTRLWVSNTVRHHYIVYDDLLQQLLKLPVCRKARVGRLLIGLKADKRICHNGPKILKLGSNDSVMRISRTGWKGFGDLRRRFNSVQIVLYPE